MNRQEVLEQLEPLRNTQVREVEHTPRTRVVVTPDMVTLRPGGGARTLEVTKLGVESMAKFINFPQQTLDRLRPETRGLVATELLSKKGQYSLVVKDGAVVDVAKRGHYRAVNPERVLKAIEAGVPGIEYHRALVLPGSVVSLEVVGDRRQPVSRGDMIQAGANIAFSPLGLVFPSVQSYVLRLACTNGATDRCVLREFEFERGGGGGEGDDIWHWFRTSVRDAYNALDRIVNRYQQMEREEVTPENRAMILEAMLREAGIRGEDAEAVRALALQSPPETNFDMHNLITYASSHILERPAQIRRAQEAAATFSSATEHARICPVCNAQRR